MADETLSLEQRKAIAIAEATLRVQQQQNAAQSAPVAPPSPQQRLEADIAGLNREIQRAQNATDISQEKKDSQLEILNAELNEKLKLKSVMGAIETEGQPGTADPWAFDKDKFKKDLENKKQPYGFNEFDVLGAGTGAAAGAVAGALPAAKQGALSMANQMGAAFRGAPTGVENWTREMGYQNRGAKNYKQSHEFEQGKRKAGAWRNPATGEVRVLEFKVAKPPVVPTSPLQDAGNAAKSVMSNPIVRGGMAGLGVGAGGLETEHRIREGDPLGATLSGLSTVGSALSAFPKTSVPGTLASVGGAGALALADKIRNKLAEEQKQRGLNPPAPPSQSELDAAGRPAFGRYPRIARPEQISGAILQELNQQMQDFSAGPATAAA